MNSISTSRLTAATLALLCCAAPAAYAQSLGKLTYTATISGTNSPDDGWVYYVDNNREISAGFTEFLVKPTFTAPPPPPVPGAPASAGGGETVAAMDELPVIEFRPHVRVVSVTHTGVPLSESDLAFYSAAPESFQRYDGALRGTRTFYVDRIPEGMGFGIKFRDETEGTYLAFASSEQWVGTTSFEYQLEFYNLIVEHLLAGPTAQQQLDETGSIMVQTGLGTILITRTNVRDAVAGSFASRDNTVFMSTQGRDAGTGTMMGDTYVWMRVSGFRSEEDDRSFSSPLLQLGVDVELNDNLLAGLSVGRANLDASSPDFSYTGQQTMVQPYLGWRSGDWHGTASLSLGKIDYDEITHSGGTAAAEGDLRAFSAEVKRDIELGKGRTLTPTLGLSKGRVELASTSGSLAGSGVGESVDFTRASIGAEWRQALSAGSLTLGLSGDYTDTNAPIALSSGEYDQNGWAGTASLGFQTELANGFSIDLGLSLGGLGQDFSEKSAWLEIGKKF